jgi:hypothetical protein
MPCTESGPDSAYSPALSWPETPRWRASTRNTSGWRTRPIAWSWRAIDSPLAPGGTTKRTGGRPASIFVEEIS